MDNTPVVLPGELQAGWHPEGSTHNPMLLSRGLLITLPRHALMSAQALLTPGIDALPCDKNPSAPHWLVSGVCRAELRVPWAMGPRAVHSWACPKKQVTPGVCW